jgi:hypothetical protein
MNLSVNHLRRFLPPLPAPALENGGKFSGKRFLIVRSSQF